MWNQNENDLERKMRREERDTDEIREYCVREAFSYAHKILRFRKKQVRRKTMKTETVRLAAVLCGAAASFAALADTVIVSDSPTVVRNAEIREALKQDTKWTSENIQAHPYLFIQDQIRQCDKLRAKIEARNIALTRMGKQAARTVEESCGLITRYTKFLADAKAAYKQAEKNGSWPVMVNGFALDEEQLSDRIADALERIELAKKDKTASEAIGKKVKIRQGVLKAKTRELRNTRLKLVQQGEQVKMNAELAKIGELTGILGIIKDMILEVDEDPTKLTVEDLTSGDPDAKKKSKVRAFLDN